MADRPVYTQRSGFNPNSIILIVVSAVVAVVGWSLVSRYSGLPAFMIPPPSAFVQQLGESLADGSLLYHTWITLREVLLGLAAGAGAAILLGYLLAKSPTAEKLLAPYIVASQSVPVVAIAPLLVIWFGSGIISKVIIASLIVFFPVLVNTVVGVRAVPEDLHNLMRSLRATRWQTLRYLEIPAALPVFLGGLRIGATLAVIGAVVGEFVGADKGLGFLINVARGLYDIPLVFVAVFALIVMAMSLYGVVRLLETRLLAWQQQAGSKVTLHESALPPKAGSDSKGESHE
jgi:NitT/TauT family transport system permease protein